MKTKPVEESDLKHGTKLVNINSGRIYVVIEIPLTDYWNLCNLGGGIFFIMNKKKGEAWPSHNFLAILPDKWLDDIKPWDRFKCPDGAIWTLIYASMYGWALIADNGVVFRPFAPTAREAFGTIQFTPILCQNQ